MDCAAHPNYGRGPTACGSLPRHRTTAPPLGWKRRDAERCWLHHRIRRLPSCVQDTLKLVYSNKSQHGPLRHRPCEPSLTKNMQTLADERHSWISLQMQTQPAPCSTWNSVPLRRMTHFGGLNISSRTLASIMGERNLSNLPISTWNLMAAVQH